MKTFTTRTVTACALLTLSTGVMAQDMSKADYKAAKEKIIFEYETSQSACNSMSGNAKDICRAESKGKKQISAAELEAAYEPSPKHRQAIGIARAKAVYEVSTEKCDDLAGKAKNLCNEDAKAAKASALSETKAQMNITKPNDVSGSTQ